MRHPKLRTLAAVALPLVLLLALAGIASADVKLTSVLHSWGYDTLKWENGNVVIQNDGGWQPFWVGIDFDADTLASTYCGGGQSKWTGNAQIGHYKVSNDDGAGFQRTREWKLVRCSTFDNDADIEDPTLDPADIVLDCVVSPATGRCVVTAQDFESTVCKSQCKLEIQRDWAIDLASATSCAALDPAIVTKLDGDDLCMYWEAQRPSSSQPLWGDSLVQARVTVVADTTGNGEKTVNFVLEPTAISLQHFSASARAAGVSPLAVVLGIALVGLSGLALAWRSARG